MKWQEYFADNFRESAQNFKLSFILGYMYLFFCDNMYHQGECTADNRPLCHVL